MIADRIADSAARIAEERIREMFKVTEFDPDEVFGFMDSHQAAEFLGLPYSSFREIAPLATQARYHAGEVRVSATGDPGVG